MPTLTGVETVAIANIQNFYVLITANTSHGTTALGPFPLSRRVNTMSGAQGFNDNPSPGPIHVQPPFAAGSKKCTYPFVFFGVGGPFRSFVVSSTSNSNSTPRSMRNCHPDSSSCELSQYAHSSYHPRYIISYFTMPLFPELSFHNWISLLPKSFQNRLLSQPKLSSPKSTSSFMNCPSCSVFHTSTATRISPFFAESRGDVSLYDFDAAVILPLRYLTTSSWLDKAASRLGSACISKIWIHPAHHDFHETVKTPKNIFALKKLRSDRKEDFKREARALHAFVVYPHEHVVRLLAAFRHDGSFYLLFPWARGGSLRSFWRRHPRPTVDTEVSTWVAKQSLGIAAALHEIHDQHVESQEKNRENAGQLGQSINIRGYHGDIKPENILLFEGDRQGSSCHVWKIGDFGVSHRFLVAAHRGDIPKGFTPAYQSPEHQIDGRIDGCADIWSLGCVLLETAVWLLWGYDGLARFGLMRQAANRLNVPNNINSDTFFDVVDSSLNTVPVPVLKPSVLQCIERLSCHPNVSPYLTDLLHLIRRYLLDVNRHSRLSSELLVKVLRQLHQRCVDTPAYTVAVPRPQKPPLLKRIVHYENNNRCIADLPTSSNPLTLKTTPQMILNYMASSRNTALQTPWRRDQAMALGSGAPTSSQWLDDYIGQQLNEADLSLSAQGPFDNIFNPSIQEEMYLSPPNLLETQPSRKRVFNSITDPDDEECHRKTKYQKRGETLQRNLETNPPVTDTSSPPNALKIPQLASPSTAVSTPRMFACPFSKRSGDKYLTTKDWKCCLGPNPGWTIHRLKEHLYRKHTSRNYQCPRCLAEFEDNSDLHQHQRSTTPCLIHTNTESEIERIDAGQIIKLKKKSRRFSDEEKWNDIYRIVFRLDSTADLPSPYYEDIIPVSNIEPSPYYGVDSLSQFQSYLQNRLQDCQETQQNMSTIQACMVLIKGFQEAKDFSLPLSEAPSLVFDNSAFSTMSYEPNASTTFSMTNEYNLNTSDKFEDMSTDTLAGLALFDNSLETRLNEVFGP